MNKFWSNATNIYDYLTQQGHKSWFIQTVIAHVASLGDYYKLWQRHVIHTPHIAMSQLSFDERIHDPVQSRFMEVFKLLLRKRDEHYEQAAVGNDNEYEDDHNDDDN